MANHKSSEKRARQDIKKTLVNKVNESKSRSAVKTVRAALASGDKTTAAAALKTAQSNLRKLAKSGVIKKNTAARRTSRLAAQVSNLK